MHIRLIRIVLFVDDLDRQTAFYRDVLRLPIGELRAGWSEFATGATSIALHRGKGRRPRLEFECEGPLEAARAALTARGLKLGEIQTLRERRFCRGKDRDGNQIQISEAHGRPG